MTECFKAGTLAKAGLLVCCIFGKLAMGCFAQPRDADHFWILAFAWGEWGEFSFLIATAARRVDGDGILDATRHVYRVLSIGTSPPRRVLARSVVTATAVSNVGCDGDGCVTQSVAWVPVTVSRHPACACGATATLSHTSALSPAVRRA